ncbi:DNA translocase FtsK [Actibacterium ureilyticum]|uniref:DNA translocase FtsK n=1 Tax=Actibacterium ureilyticum TaxID=1590614 RepID=UPI000BAAD355|nr:DNA translocase FtsK [Actibacterium ureilyticum]
MASYPMKQRDPLFDSNMQAAIERRSRELIGLGLIAAGILVAMMLGSYTPDDPSWLSATDQPAQNLLGRFGASIASPLFVIVGWGAWGVAVGFLVWGARFVLHRGAERVFARAVFVPIAIALVSIYATVHTTPADWPHSFGMSGLFGETVMGAVLNILPVKATFGLKVIAAIVAFAAAGMSLYALGFDGAELRRIGRFLLLGMIVAYDGLMRLLGQGATGAVQGAQALHARARARRAANARAQEYAPEPRVHRAAEPDYSMDAAPVIEESFDEKPGLMARMPSLIRRKQASLEPELIEHHLPDDLADAPGPNDERIRARIAEVINNRARQKPTLNAMRSEPPLMRSRMAEPPLHAPVPQVHATAPMAPSVTVPPAPETDFDMDMAAAYDAQPGYDDYDDHAPLDTDDTHMADPMMDEAPQQAPMPVPRQELSRRVVQHPVKKPVQPSRRAQAEAQPALQFEESSTDYELPPLSLLTNPTTIERHVLSDEALEENARMLENVLDDYGVKGEIVSVRPGPVVTMYELEPAPGLKASRVIGLADDIARSMSALSARVSTVPGRSVIGIELPNANREKVVLREILASRDYGDGNHRLPLALGKDIGGDSMVANLAKMPHLLIAGTTGSGKSVAINTMILSLLYKLTPDDCRLIMIDPKMLELSVYDGIPHLLSPVVTDPKKAVVALKWVVGEMEERYRKMSKMGVRNIEGYNGRVADAQARGEMFSRTVQTGFDDETGDPIFETEEFAPEKMPFIVVIVDEMADLMMVAGKEIEACIQRLAQMARASGIHLIMATQRPSVDVITGTIKANFPTRISFQVTSKVDSRTILGEMGAEQLLGMGDMLYMAGGGKITRCHGPFVSDEEVEEIVNHLKSFGPPDYKSGVVDGPDEEKESDIDAVLGLGGNTNGEDALYDQAVAIVIKDRKCSTSYIQRKLAIGYNKAARLVEQMEEEGVVSSANHVGKREILVPEQA